MFSMKVKTFGKKGMKRKLAAATLAGIMMLSACGKNTGSGKTGGTSEAGGGAGGQEIATEVTRNGEGVSAPAGITTNLSAGLTGSGVVEATSEEEETFLNETADLSFELMRYLTKGENGNVMISPESIITALVMTENGAAGETLDQMMSVLCGGLTLEQYNKAVSGFNRKLVSTQPASLSMANSIWMRNDPELAVNSSFLQTNIDYHDSEFFVAEFDNGTLNDVNGWISDKTNKMIPEALQELRPETQMLLINAAAFEAKWMDEYEEMQVKEDRIFTNSAGKEENVTMLSSSENGLITLNGGQGFAKFYEGGEFAYVALLPAEGVSAEEYLLGISGEDFLKAYRDRNYTRDIIAMIPEYSSDYDTSLVNAFEELGMTEPFSNSADFSGMLASGRSQLKIGDIIHKTHIDVDRNGTRAAAVTIVEMDKASDVMEEEPPVMITLDRPFVYAIVEAETGLPVFLGIVNTVE